jgi:hypothetical protein
MYIAALVLPDSLYVRDPHPLALTVILYSSWIGSILQMEICLQSNMNLLKLKCPVWVEQYKFLLGITNHNLFITT